MKRLLSLILVVVIICSLSTVSAFAASANETVELPPADGIDIGVNEESDSTTMAFWYSKYNYKSESFGIGVYFNGGKSFTCRSSRNPYLQNASHSKVKNSNPSYYHISYQMIYADTKEVRKGVYFGGDISDLKVYFDVKESNDFIFYIAGDSSNTYCASGTLRY